MKKANKSGKMIRSRMVCKFKKNTATAPCSNTWDPTTTTTTTSEFCLG